MDSAYASVSPHRSCASRPYFRWWACTSSGAPRSASKPSNISSVVIFVPLFMESNVRSTARMTASVLARRSMRSARWASSSVRRSTVGSSSILRIASSANPSSL